MTLRWIYAFFLYNRNSDSFTRLKHEGDRLMRRVMIGQMLLILCCIFYLIWWYRGFRPNVIVSRVGGVNGILLMITAALGLAGIFISMSHIPAEKEPKLDQSVIVLGGIILYVGLLLVTKLVFHRIVTTELILIVGWTVLELTVINRLNAAGYLSEGKFFAICIVIAIAFLISMVLYVAYYRMEEMKAFYAAMVPLITESVAMAVLVGMLIK